MTEAELLQGITDALTIAGWRWTHIRRSDGITQGFAGLPDIIAAHPMRTVLLAWELKATDGVVSVDQLGWLLAAQGPGVDARVVRPSQYDEALAVIIQGVPPLIAFGTERIDSDRRPPSADAQTFVP
jgi:hypothetical protein